jgi:hypothetical protein
MGELPNSGEVRRRTCCVEPFPPGIFHRRLIGKNVEQKCNREGGQRHDIAVVLDLVKAFFDHGAGVVGAILLLMGRRSFGISMGAARKKFETRQAFEQAMRSHRRPEERERHNAHRSKALHTLPLTIIQTIGKRIHLREVQRTAIRSLSAFALFGADHLQCWHNEQGNRRLVTDRLNGAPVDYVSDETMAVTGHSDKIAVLSYGGL